MHLQFICLILFYFLLNKIKHKKKKKRVNCTNLPCVLPLKQNIQQMALITQTTPVVSGQTLDLTVDLKMTKMPLMNILLFILFNEK